MKTCPICNARCFDDMETCFGCMHQFPVSLSDDPLEGSEGEIRIPVQHISHEEPSNLERKNQPRHAAPIKIDIAQVQEKEVLPIARARYQLTISLEPM